MTNIRKTQFPLFSIYFPGSRFYWGKCVGSFTIGGKNTKIHNTKNGIKPSHPYDRQRGGDDEVRSWIYQMG
jgi:hypothetical protein